MNEQTRRYEDRAFDRRRDQEIIEAVKKYDEHERWCPECKISAKAMCKDGRDLLEDVYLVLRSRAV